MDKKSKSQKNNININFSLLFAIVSLCSLFLSKILYPLTGHTPCGNSGTLTYLLTLGFPTLISILSIVFSVKALTKKEKPKFLPIISIVLSLPSIFFLALGLITDKPCPKNYDNEKKDDISSISASITSYQSDNKGYLPNDISDLKPYLDRELNKYDHIIIPDFSYKNTDLNPKPYSAKTNEIQIYLGAECNDEDQTIIRSKSIRNFAILTKLKEANSYYCINN